MSDKPMISRREFITISAAAAATLLARSRLPGFLALQAGEQNLLRTRLISLLTHQESARAVGQAYAQAYPQEAGAPELLSSLAGSLSLTELDLFGASEQQLRARIDRSSRADFAAERTVKLQGWILSATEARLCALAALV